MAHVNLKAQHADLEAQHADLKAQHADLEAQHADLKARFAEMDRQTHVIAEARIDLYAGNLLVKLVEMLAMNCGRWLSVRFYLSSQPESTSTTILQLSDQVTAATEQRGRPSD
ncbi:MAG: hypothetical protein M1815_004478 [Lichina confinis]|nr:MAG: hypothetical protein M1815_004478 [Lichina confinis]